MRITADRAEIAALVADAPPTVLRREPTFRLRRDLVSELLHSLGVCRLRGTNDERHRTTPPAPPRRGSPAAANAPSRRSATAAAPPKCRLRRRHRTSFHPTAWSGRSAAGWLPASRCKRWP